MIKKAGKSSKLNLINLKTTDYVKHEYCYYRKTEVALNNFVIVNIDLDSA